MLCNQGKVGGIIKKPDYSKLRTEKIIKLKNVKL